MLFFFLAVRLSVPIVTFNHIFLLTKKKRNKAPQPKIEGRIKIEEGEKKNWKWFKSHFFFIFLHLFSLEHLSKHEQEQKMGSNENRTKQFA